MIRHTRMITGIIVFMRISYMTVVFFAVHEMEIHYNKEGKEEIAGADLTPSRNTANAAVQKQDII